MVPADVKKILLFAFASIHSFKITSMTLSRQMRTSPVFRATSAAAAAAESDPITITGDNIPLTPALTDYINTKLSRALSKVTGPNSPARCDVHLVVAKNPRVNDGQKCEITTFVKGSVMRSVSACEDARDSSDKYQIDMDGKFCFKSKIWLIEKKILSNISNT